MTVLLTQYCTLLQSDMHNIFINYITEEKEANMYFSLWAGRKRFLLIRLTDNFSTEAPLKICNRS